MKTSAAVALSGFAGFSLAGVCSNNCGRQVFGTALARPPIPTAQAQRSSACSQFLTTYTTVTPAAATATVTGAPIFARNVHVRAPAPALVSPKPSWATACASDVDFYNACQCFGITPTIITVTAPTSTQTTTVAGPTCTQGVEYAHYVLSGDRAALLRYPREARNIDLLSPPAVLSGVSPASTGVVPKIGASSSSGAGPLQIAGAPPPQAGLISEDNVVVYRGYIIPATAGLYTFSVDRVDDELVIWTGDAAVSAVEDVSQKLLGAAIEAFVYNYGGYMEASITVDAGDVGKAVPFKIFYGNCDGVGGFGVKVTDPEGNVILGVDTPVNAQVVAGCDAGGPAAAWPAWE